MLRKFLLVAATLLIPTLLSAQSIPNAHASDTAKSKVAQHRATRSRGKAEGLSHRPVTPATPAVPASKGTSATPAVPASPASPPSTRGQSGSRRP